MAPVLVHGASTRQSTGLAELQYLPRQRVNAGQASCVDQSIVAPPTSANSLGQVLTNNSVRVRSEPAYRSRRCVESPSRAVRRQGARFAWMATRAKRRRRRWLGLLIIPALLLVTGYIVVPRSQPAAVTKVTAIRFSPTLVSRISKANLVEFCRKAKRDRIGLPAELLSHNSGEDVRTTVASDLANDLRAAIAELPAPLAHAFDRHVCSVVFVTGLGATGVTAQLASEPSRSVILLNVDNLDRSANAWVSFKESSFFSEAHGLAIVGKMTERPDKSRQVLLGYLIAHELGHVLRDALPNDPHIASFDRACWPRKDAFKDLSLRPYAALHGADSLHEINLEPLYDFILASCFPSLTAAMNPGEDFADSLALYSHSVLLGRPWQVSVYRDGELSRRLESCWREPRCAEKRQALERFLDGFRTP